VPSPIPSKELFKRSKLSAACLAASLACSAAYWARFNFSSGVLLFISLNIAPKAIKPAIIPPPTRRDFPIPKIFIASQIFLAPLTKVFLTEVKLSLVPSNADGRFLMLSPSALNTFLI
jgi:hypothetical protein